MILLYKGTSAISRMIRWINWSCYSHAGWMDPTTGTVYEAWAGSVRMVRTPAHQHNPKTEVDLFHVPESTGRVDQVRDFLKAQVGKKYDYRGVMHFIGRRPEHQADQDRWFCSELVFAAYAAAGIDLLLRIEPFKVYPGLLALSPLLTYVDSGVCDTDRVVWTNSAEEVPIPKGGPQ